MIKIAIIGAGKWGQALAKIFSSQSKIILWSYKKINFESEQSNIILSYDINEVTKCDVVLIALPAQNVRENCKLYKKNISKKTPIIICSKGIESSTLYLLSEVIEEELSHKNVAILSGPNFSHEVQVGLPFAATLACTDNDLSNYLLQVLHNNNLTIHCSNDIIGTQIFGAVKNVIAIACGVFLGKKLGMNAQAALITYGMKEIIELCKAKNGNTNSALELCGIGDLILTCTSRCSRNVSFGIELTKGKSIQKILSEQSTTEGAYTAKTVHHLAQNLNIKMNICESVYEIIYNNADINCILKKVGIFS